MPIPKLIMQTWKNTELPDEWKSSPISIKKYMPDWTYILMTDNMNRKFIKQHFPAFLTTYDTFPYPIQRADAIRYAWLYVNGGIYIDCDFELLAPLDELFVEEHDLYLLESANTPGVLTNMFMASKPKNQLWLDMIEDMSKPPGIYAIEKHLLIMNTTGPMALTRVMKRTKHKYKQLPNTKVNPYTLCDTEYNNPSSLTKPLPGSSWVGPAAKLYHVCYCQGMPIIGWVLVVVVIILTIVSIMYT